MWFTSNATPAVQYILKVKMKKISIISRLLDRNLQLFPCDTVTQRLCIVIYCRLYTYVPLCACKSMTAEQDVAHRTKITVSLKKSVRTKCLSFFIPPDFYCCQRSPNVLPFADSKPNRWVVRGRRCQTTHDNRDRQLRKRVTRRACPTESRTAHVN